MNGRLYGCMKSVVRDRAVANLPTLLHYLRNDRSLYSQLFTDTYDQIVVRSWIRVNGTASAAAFVTINR